MNASTKRGSRVGVFVLMLCASVQAGATDRVWAEHPFAAVQVGVDTTHHDAPVYDLVVVGLASPEMLTADGAKLWSHCTDQALAEWTLAVAPDLERPRKTSAFVDPAMPYGSLARVDAVVSDLTGRFKEDDPSTAVTAAAVGQLRASRIKEIGRFLDTSSPGVVPLIAKCAGDAMTNQAKPHILVMFSLLRCPIPTPAAPHPCNPGAAAGTGVVVVRERAYAQMAAWMHSEGVRDHGVWIETPHLDAEKQTYPVVVAKDIGPSLYVVPEVPIEQKLAQFEALAAHLRAERARAAENATKVVGDAHDALIASINRANGIAPEIPLAIGMTQESAAHVVDLIQQPMDAVEHLKTDAQAGTVQVLASISDEVARSRLIECVQLRKLDGAALAEIATCSGYKVTDETLRACMNGQRCMPAFNATGYAEVVRITQDLNLRGLANATLIPRLQSIDLPSFESLARQCGQANAAVAGDGEYEAAAMNCVLRKSSLEAAKMISCTNDAGSDRVKLLHCATLSGGTVSAAVSCWQDHSDNVSDAALCAGGSQLPPGTLACVNAFRSSGNGENAAKDCLSVLVSGDPRVSKMLSSLHACIKHNPTDRNRATLCMVMPALSHDEGVMFTCASQASSWDGFAGCALTNELPSKVGGALGEMLNCGIQSGGDAAGTAICLVGPKLNRDQQILLQCAATSGGEPNTFAVCAGGQLAMKEFINCRNVHFGEGACFGRNNDIHKLIRNLGLGDIHQGTVVGDLLDKQLDVFKTQVQIAQVMIHGAGALVAGVGRAVKELGNDLNRVGGAVTDGVHAIGNALGLGHVFG